MRIILLLLWHLALCAADFDCILIGSSPFSLFEALYQAQCGKKVLILETDPVCGGAWKSIDMCGVSRVDLGCHKISSDKKLKDFLERYAGCSFTPLEKLAGNFYFAHGCRDLIDHLLALLEAAGVTIATCQRANSVAIQGKLAIVKTDSSIFTTEKLIVTPMSTVIFEGARSPQGFAPSKYYHLYLLIQDSSPPKFSYKDAAINGVKRMTNLTPFTDLVGTGRQLIILQTHSEEELSSPESYMDALKKKKWISESAYLLACEPYIYEAGKFNNFVIQELKAEEIVEVLQTGTFHALCNYIEKWQSALKPYAEIFPIAN